MFPSHLSSEITRRMRAGRLSKSKATSLAKAVGIDLAASLSPHPSADVAAMDLQPHRPEGEVLRGSVEFNITIEAFGESRLVHCRTLYATALTDDEDAVTGTPIRAIGSMASRSEALVWNDEQPAPEWHDFDERMLLPAAVAQIDDLIEQQAVAQELAEKSSE